MKMYQKSYIKSSLDKIEKKEQNSKENENFLSFGNDNFFFSSGFSAGGV